jgi:AraC-like DNA-binding protein
MAPELPWTPVDPLGEALHALQVHGAFYCRSELTAPWGLEMPAFERCLSFHAVTAGEAWLEVDDERVRLRRGDLAVVPHGRGHLLRDAPGGPVLGRVDLLPQEMVTDHYSVLTAGGGGQPTTLVCGIVELDHPTARRLTASLPRLLLVEGDDPVRSAWVQPTLSLMATEVAHTRPGGETVVTRLADVLVIQAIRAWLDEEDSHTGWLLALRQPQVGRALALVHRHPEDPWTVASLATEVAMSRSAFAARFTELVGEPPLQYLTRWRMELATTALSSGATVAQVAGRYGYDSEAAFSRAFKRILGVSPGAVSRRGVPDGA